MSYCNLILALQQSVLQAHSVSLLEQLHSDQLLQSLGNSVGTLTL
jgi:hypothetical protein